MAAEFVLSVMVIILHHLYQFNNLVYDDVKSEALSTSDIGKIKICYFTSSSYYRPSAGSFKIEHVNPELCSHLIYGFADIDDNWNIKSRKPELDVGINNNSYYKNITNLHQQYPDLKILLSVGGWLGSKRFSALARSESNRALFIYNALLFLKKYNFDGLDINWSYPTRGGFAADKNNFVTLLKELNTTLRENNYLLTAVVHADVADLEKVYNIAEIVQYVDFISAMTFNYHGPWNDAVLPPAALDCDNRACVKASIKHLLKRAPPEKIVLGIPFYARTYIVTSTTNLSNENPLNKPCKPEGFAGPLSKTKNFLSFNEVCYYACGDANETAWHYGRDDKTSTAYITKNNYVALFDDFTSIKRKIDFAKEMNLLGICAYDMDDDDFTGRCSENCAKTFPEFQNVTNYPLLRYINEQWPTYMTKPAPLVSPKNPTFASIISRFLAMMIKSQ